jgi:hypothetical protein
VTLTTFALARLEAKHRRMGRELKVARLASKNSRAAVARAVAFKTESAVRGIEVGRNFTRAGRLRVWCEFLGIEAEAFLCRYEEVILPDAAKPPVDASRAPARPRSEPPDAAQIAANSSQSAAFRACPQTDVEV